MLSITSCNSSSASLFLFVDFLFFEILFDDRVCWEVFRDDGGFCGVNGGVLEDCLDRLFDHRPDVCDNDVSSCSGSFTSSSPSSSSSDSAFISNLSTLRP